ncbi:MAG TPA: YrhA family protein [Blastocatellia bacterium]|nr:YrhA family protein [Blastocatellia bacterium]
MTYRIYLEEIRKWKAQTGRSLQPPASEQDILELRRSSLAELGTDIPAGYADLLRVTDGLCFGGLCIYATRRVRVDLGHRTYDIEGFVEATLVWRSMDDDGADLLVFGEGDIDIYIYNPANSRYEVQDRGSRDIVAAYPSFDELMEKALWTGLPPDLRAKFPPRPKGERL